MRVIETSLDEDLSLFSRFLWQERVQHRIFEERGRQVLEVGEAQAADYVRTAYDSWRSGRLVIEARARAAVPGKSRLLALKRIISRLPVLCGLLLVAVLVFPVSTSELATWLTIADPRAQQATDLTALFGSWQLWRLVTPIFLHFSIVHLLFNLVVTFDLGRRVELIEGSRAILLLVLGIAVISNVCQYLLGASPLFGGLSGVGYGLLGYVLVSQRLVPEQPGWHVNPGFAVSLLIFLVLFSTGITEPFGLHVANPAHWSGLAAGAGFALLGKRGRIGGG